MNNINWIITNKRNDASPLIGMEPLFRTMSEYTSVALNINFETKFMIEFNQEIASMAAIEKDWEKFGLVTLENLKNESFFNNLINGLTSSGNNLIKISSLIKNKNYINLTNNELLVNTKETFNVLLDFFKYNHIVNSTDFYHDVFTKYLYSKLDKYNKEENSIGSLYSILSTPNKDVWIQEEEENFYNLIFKYRKQNTQKNKILFNESLEEYTSKYFWIEYEQQGKEINSNDVLNKIKIFIKSSRNELEELKILKKRRKQMQLDRIHLEKKLQLSKEDMYIFKVARELVYWKLHLRELKVRFYCCTNNLLKECARRLNISFSEVRFLTEKELYKYIITPSLLDKKNLQERVKYCVFNFENKETQVYVGKKAKEKFSKLLNQKNDKKTLLHGMCGYPGFVKGNVCKVLGLNDISNFRKGQILTAYMTDISIVPAMKRAGAIVTDVGGVTCHAAIVSREFKIPCLIGTKYVTDFFDNGDNVSVDADKGKIQLINKVTKTYNVPEKVEEKLKVNMILPYSSEVKSIDISPLHNIMPYEKNIFGGKAESLGFLIRNGFLTPNGFALSASAFEYFIIKNNLAYKINILLKSIEFYSELENVSQQIISLIKKAPFDGILKNQIYDNFDKLNFSRVAVRSSAPSEDSKEFSWAGQFDSYLNISRFELLDMIKSCWASSFTARALSYRSTQKTNNENIFLGVIIQEMIHSKISGTAFSINPINNNQNELIIESCIGLGELLVSGKITPSTYIVDKQNYNIINKKIVQQDIVSTSNSLSNGVQQKTLEKLNNTLEIPEIIFYNLIKSILYIEEIYQLPIDIEWVYDGISLYIVQARPITTV